MKGLLDPMECLAVTEGMVVVDEVEDDDSITPFLRPNRQPRGHRRHFFMPKPSWRLTCGDQVLRGLSTKIQDTIRDFAGPDTSHTPAHVV